MSYDPFQTQVSIAVLAVGLYVVIVSAMSCCGWRQLARNYSAELKPSGPTFRNVSGWITLLGSYRHALTVVSSLMGVYVETPWFVFFHRPLLFPWRCVSAIDRRAGILTPYTGVTISAGGHRFRLRLPERAAAEFLSHAALGS